MTEDKQILILSQKAINHMIISAGVFSLYFVEMQCFHSFSVPLLDDGCKSKNLSKREKRKPPGTVEFIVSINIDNMFI